MSEYEDDYEYDSGDRPSLESRREAKRLEQQTALYAALGKLGQKPAFNWPVEWAGPKSEIKDTKMPVFRVVVTRKLSIRQADDSLQSVERLVVSKEIIATGVNVAALIAGKGLKETDEELSTATIRVVAV